MESVLKLQKNTNGRDFIIGDLHGCYDMLMEKMQQVSFNKETDRLFSVGDLIDRGPKSLKCAKLVYEDWFYPVRGNHEEMFFTFAIGKSSLYSPYDFLYNGGHWVNDCGISRDDLKSLAIYMDENMPYAIEVEGDDGFIVCHAKYNEVLLENIADIYNRDNFVWDRSFVHEIASFGKELFDQMSLEYGETFILDEYDFNKKLVYVGHNTLNNGNNVLIYNHLMIDSGAYRKELYPHLGFNLTMKNHNEVMKFIREEFKHE